MPVTSDDIYAIQDALRDEGDSMPLGVVQNAVEKIQNGGWPSNSIEMGVELHMKRLKLIPAEEKTE
jgi:hypothetical protein|tara:strand:+ start:183 stop:380 length:198 start_codon:yes stop_codon:yes gene_type:complete